MKTLGIFVLPALAHASFALAQYNSTLPVPEVLPPSRSIRPNYPNYSHRPIDEVYRLTDRQLNCTLSDGQPVPIRIAREGDSFSFLAVRDYSGPMILVNDQHVSRLQNEYAAFSFYRECAIHSLTDVVATPTSQSAEYSREVMRGADCLAVLPTLKNRSGSTAESILTNLVRSLKQEYGSNYPATLGDLRRCIDISEVTETARRVRAAR